MQIMNDRAASQVKQVLPAAAIAGAGNVAVNLDWREW